MAKLTAKQQRFCDEYLIDLNATQAAIRAGYSPKGMNKRVTRMMANEGIQAYIQQRQSDLVDRTEITQEMVVNELASIAFSNATDYAQVIEKTAMVEANGEMIPLTDADGNEIKYRTVEPTLTANLTEGQKKALAVIKKGKDGFEVKPYDKIRALELLGKHIGMFRDKVQLDIAIPVYGGEDDLED